jgi:hypothetical protein
LALELVSHFVAFIDILGFSEMVRADCESSDAPKHLERLYDSHVAASASLGGDLQSGLIQFSDSIVFSRPFDLAALPDFLRSVGDWQKSLLLEGFLCRGGVTFGKHFVKDRFMFSKGLIDAYQLESSQAKHPRIVVSDNLIQLAMPATDASALNIIVEDDGVAFVDYIRAKDDAEKAKLILAAKNVIASAQGGPASVQEKMRWLASYVDHNLGAGISGPRFSSF